MQPMYAHLPIQAQIADGTKRVAATRVEKVYKQLPPWLRRTDPRVRLNAPAAKDHAQLGGRGVGIDRTDTQALAGYYGAQNETLAKRRVIHEIAHTEGLGEAAADFVSLKEGRRLFGNQDFFPDYADRTAALVQAHPNTMRYIKKRLAAGQPQAGSVSFTAGKR